ncbi:50S ribosomal protein L1 [Patescibacteria group bacterium]|nr:50S ribosomal protein L1 [Patescibacteria group bacterium]MBU1890974.1 50S ribosomal protein L1 [Patescibacteria group bacterium]
MRSKRYQELIKKIDKNKIYSLTEALGLIKETANTKFDSSVEIHIHLGTDPKKPEQQIRATVMLPHPTGRETRIAVFANEKDQKKAQEAGAQVVGGEELIKEIKASGKLDFDVAIATPEMMRHLGQIAKILGTQGMMPNPKSETVTPDPVKTVKELLGGKVAFRSDETSNIHQIIGKVSFEPKVLEDNLKAFIDTIRKARPEGVKGTYIKSITLSSTMGPGIRVGS